MDSIKQIIFRNLTHADFFNINKPKGTEQSGGGQAYIDFPVKAISVQDWERFFSDIANVDLSQATQGPSWEFPIFSIGIDVNDQSDQRLKIYQRRAASVSITSQKTHSLKTNRIKSWHPDYGFPKPIDNTDRNQCPQGLMVYLTATYNGQVWAGWYLNDGSTELPILGDDPTVFGDMFSSISSIDGFAGLLVFEKDFVFLNQNNIKYPFKTKNSTQQIKTSKKFKEETEFDEAKIIEQLFDEDLGIQEVEVTNLIVKIRKRNFNLVKKLKLLYKNKCQITGDEFIFKKKNGVNYTEAHHLIPLGEGGSDAPCNLVVLSPQIHKMLHYANVSVINLDNMLFLEDGSGLLELTINDKPYTIQWHPNHAELFKKNNS